MIKVLHIDTESTWRGGENQIRLLIEGSRGYPHIEHHVAGQPHGALLKYASPHTPVCPVTMRSGVDIYAAWKIGQYIKKHGIHLIDAQTSLAHSLGLMVKAFLPALKLVVHRRVDYRPKPHLWNRLKYLSSGVDGYVAISFAIGQILKDFNIPSEKITVIPSGVDPTPYRGIDRLQARQTLCSTYNLNPHLPILGNASALTEQKDYPTLLRAIRVLIDQHKKPCSVLIAGEGHLRHALETLTADLGLSDTVTFVGWIQDMPPFLSGLDVLAMPSAYEGLGTLVLDAIYAGCCVVATKVGGIPEMIIHQETGFLSAVGDPTAFAQQLNAALEAMPQQPLLWAKAQQHIAQNFALNVMVHKNLSHYQRCLG